MGAPGIRSYTHNLHIRDTVRNNGSFLTSVHQLTGRFTAKTLFIDVDTQLRQRRNRIFRPGGIITSLLPNHSIPITEAAEFLRQQIFIRIRIRTNRIVPSKNAIFQVGAFDQR